MRPKAYYLSTMALSLFAVFLSNSQTVSKTNTQPHTPEMCGAGIVHEREMKNNPVYRERFLKKQKAISKISTQKLSTNSVYQIPVVVHVMHIGEPEGVGSNISDEDVIKGIRYLNEKWRNIPGTSRYGNGVDMRIEFVLAIQDENGNYTTGIDRVDLSGVPDYLNNGVKVYSDDVGLDDYNGDAPINSLKEYANWDPNTYYNIWLVYKIAGKNCDNGGIKTLGYAMYAGSHGYRSDGTIIQSCVFAKEDSFVSPHELGHAFNLLHTFEGDYDYNTETYVCGGDDDIVDTPSHIRSIADNAIYRNCDNTDANTCDPSFNQVINPDTGFVRNSGTHQDHIYNYMDYTTCASEFTGGQRAVVQDALLNVRTSYLTSSGLDPVAAPVVAFNASSSSTCVGGEITFTDTSQNVPNSFTNASYDGFTFNWTFDNGIDTPYTSTLQNPTITFNNTGSFDVTLQITNAQGTSIYTQENGVIVNESPMVACSVSSNRNDKSFDYGVRSITFNTISNQTTGYIPPNALQDFTCSNFTTIDSGSSNNLNVTYESIDGKTQNLEVWIDWDNSGTFDDVNSNGTNELILSDGVAKTDPGTHQASTTVLTPSNAVANVLLRMRVISAFNNMPDKCGNANAQRADDYGIIVNSALGIKEVEANSIKIYPNPSFQYLRISVKKQFKILNHTIYDINGKQVLQVNSDSNKIDISKLAPGFYFLKMNTDKGSFTEKFIKSVK